MFSNSISPLAKQLKNTIYVNTKVSKNSHSLQHVYSLFLLCGCPFNTQNFNNKHAYRLRAPSPPCEYCLKLYTGMCG